MTWLDIALIVLIAVYCAYVLLTKKKGGCCGDCSKCAGCANSAKRKERGVHDITH